MCIRRNGAACDDRPAVDAGGRDDGQVLRRTPEVLGGVAVEPAGVDRDVAVDAHVVGVPAEPDDRGVEADLRVDAVVVARLEHQRVPLGAELVRLLGAKTASSWAWMLAADIDGSNVITLGPSDPPPGTVPPPVVLTANSHSE